MKSNSSLKNLTSLFFILFYVSSISTAQGGYITKLQDLNFGEVFMGYSSEVLQTDPGAAKFTFFQNSKKQTNIFISFTLPAALQNGIDQLPIEFNQTHAAWSYNDQTAGRTNFDPSSRFKISKIARNENVYIWLGGRILNTSGISPGTYTGDIILTIDY